jgi:hypothetical protein
MLCRVSPFAFTGESWFWCGNFSVTRVPPKRSLNTANPSRTVVNAGLSWYLDPKSQMGIVLGGIHRLEGMLVNDGDQLRDPLGKSFWLAE